MKPRYDVNSLIKVSQIKLNTESEHRSFKIGKIQMDEDFIWSIALKFTSYFQTVNTQYNCVVLPNPDYINDRIRSIIREYSDPQTSLDDEEEEDVVDRINECIKSWNDSINRKKEDFVREFITNKEELYAGK